MSHENVSHHIAAFEELIGREAILRSVDELAAYQTPARGSAGRAFAVARPASTKQLSDLIAYCAKENIHVVPQGANTGLVEGSTPNNQPASLVVSSERLNNVLEIDPLERTARVSAGVRLSQINAAAEKFGLFFPIDLGADPTIGGMLATNTGGARFICYGGVRENTLAVTAVLGNKQGSVTEFGKGLRKDNSSIDFKQILIGSGGAYAFICECILSLAVIPRRRQTALLVPSNDDVIIEILRRAELEFGPSLSAFEFMSAAAMRAALSHQTSLRDPFSGNPPEHALLIETASTQPLREGEISTDSMGLQQFC
ncbi:MAG: FAD-binding oxidoreductase, partial [Pseudomonadota bacterium]